MLAFFENFGAKSTSTDHPQLRGSQDQYTNSPTTKGGGVKQSSKSHISKPILVMAGKKEETEDLEVARKDRDSSPNLQ